MSHNRKNRVRLAVENLEGRQLADAKPAGVLIEHMAGAIAVARPVPVEVSRMGFAGPTAPSTVHASAVSSFHYTAVTIRNSTTGTVNYSFRWGTAASKNYALSPGQSRVHYISSLNQQATISYDKSFSAGFQEQRYALAGRNIVRSAGFYLVEPTPSVGEGRLYTFKRVSNGVQLYA